MERIVLQLTRSLEGGIFEHRLAALRGADPALDQSQLPGGRLLIEGRDDTGFEFLVFRLAKAMRAYRPHIVHSRNWGAIESIPAARLAGVPIAVHTEHGYELDMLAGLPKRRRVFRRVAYAMADAVTVVTYDLRDFHARQAWVPPESIRVIYDGIDTERFRPRPGKSAELRKRFNLPGHRFIVGTVGRMVPIKDHPTLLRAVEILVRRGIDAHAVVVGSGPELEHNQQLASHSPALADRVTFTGASDDVPELLNTMDAFALTSISEGMCNSLLEAMATGLPVIATRVGGNPELIEEGRTGWLFRLGDAEVLAERLALLIGEGDRRSECGTAARQRVVERFSLKRMLQNYSELYLELARQRGIRMAR
jgi:sugar transferase (PEP-CTERM/EpsH1 system associated)